MKKFFVLMLAIMLGYIANAQDYKSVALNDTEIEILNLINDYRAENGLEELQVSMALCYVADAHVKDLYYNKPQEKSGSLNSWSNKGNWKPLNYTKDRKAVKNMMKKPSELSNYKGDAIEIAIYKQGKINPEEIVSSWKLFPQFDNVMLNLQPYASPLWKVMGIAEFNGYISVWFGDDVNNAETTKIDRHKYPYRDAEKIAIQQKADEENAHSTEQAKQKEVQQSNNIPTTPMPAQHDNSYNKCYVIVFSSEDVNNSKNFVESLKSKGYQDAEMLKVDNKIRISVKSFNAYEDAENYKNKLIKTSEFKDAWILKK